MAHGHDDPHAAAPHGHAPEPAAPPAPPPPHVFTIARGTRYLGLALWLAGFVAFLVYAYRHNATCAAWTAFASLYGFAIWLAARDTLARATAPGTAP